MAKQPKKRKERSDSVAFQTTLMQQVSAGIEPPDIYKLTKTERYFWDAITTARCDWTSIDLLHAANLAQIFADLAEQQALLDKEDYIITGTNGDQKINPRFNVVMTYSRPVLFYCSRLKIHTAATIGTSRSMIARNTAYREALQAAADIDEEEALLIPRPEPTNKRH